MPIWPSGKLPFECKKIAKNLTLFFKKLPKIVIFQKKNATGNFFEKLPIFGYFLTFKWQFSGGSDWHQMSTKCIKIQQNLKRPRSDLFPLKLICMSFDTVVQLQRQFNQKLATNRLILINCRRGTLLSSQWTNISLGRIIFAWKKLQHLWYMVFLIALYILFNLLKCFIPEKCGTLFFNPFWGVFSLFSPCIGKN